MTESVPLPTTLKYLHHQQSKSDDRGALLHIKALADCHLQDSHKDFKPQLGLHRQPLDLDNHCTHSSW
eukprot:2757284-Rhodomonas_salina.1